MLAGGSVLLRNIEAKVIEEATAELLEDALQAFLDGGGERKLVAIYQVSDLAVLILYTE